MSILLQLTVCLVQLAVLHDDNLTLDEVLAVLQSAFAVVTLGSADSCCTLRTVTDVRDDNRRQSISLSQAEGGGPSFTAEEITLANGIDVFTNVVVDVPK